MPHEEGLRLGGRRIRPWDTFPWNVQEARRRLERSGHIIRLAFQVLRPDGRSKRGHYLTAAELVFLARNSLLRISEPRKHLFAGNERRVPQNRQLTIDFDRGHLLEGMRKDIEEAAAELAAPKELVPS